MLAIVARSTTGSAAAPGPKYSTNFPTTFAFRSIWVTVSARSVAVTPSRSTPVKWTPTPSCGSTGPEVFDKLPHDLRLSEHLGHGQRQVRCGHAFPQYARQVDAHHIRRQEIDRLPQHACLRLDAADAPAHNAQAIDHRCVRIRSDQCVGVEDS